jgi:hypothetical protein
MQNKFFLDIKSKNPINMFDFDKLSNSFTQYLTAVMLQSAVNKQIGIKRFPSLNKKESYKIKSSELYIKKEDICNVLNQYMLLPFTIGYNVETAYVLSKGIESMISKVSNLGFFEKGEEEVSFKPTKKLIINLICLGYLQPYKSLIF